jgi:hypothetical protein
MSIDTSEHFGALEPPDSYSLCIPLHAFPRLPSIATSREKNQDVVEYPPSRVSTYPAATGNPVIIYP